MLKAMLPKKEADQSRTLGQVPGTLSSEELRAPGKATKTETGSSLNNAFDALMVVLGIFGILFCLFVWWKLLSWSL